MIRYSELFHIIKGDYLKVVSIISLNKNKNVIYYRIQTIYFYLFKNLNF